MFSSGTALGVVGFDLGLGDSVFNTFIINSLGLTMPSSVGSALDRDALGDLVVALDRTEADLERGMLDDSATGLVDRAELCGSITGFGWAELDGVLVLNLLALIGLSGVLSAEAFAVDRAELTGAGIILPPTRLTPPYLGSTDRAFSVGFPILDVAVIPILDLDDPDAIALPATLPALEESVPPAGLIRDGVGFTVTGGFLGILDFVSP
jgi:hypothetical protein